MEAPCWRLERPKTGHFWAWAAGQSYVGVAYFEVYNYDAAIAYPFLIEVLKDANLWMDPDLIVTKICD